MRWRELWMMSRIDEEEGVREIDKRKREGKRRR